MYTSNPGPINFGFKNQQPQYQPQYQQPMYQQPMQQQPMYGNSYQNAVNPNYEDAYKMLPNVIDTMVNNGQIGPMDRNTLMSILPQQQQGAALNNALNARYPAKTDPNNLDWFLTGYVTNLINSMRRPVYQQPMYGQPMQQQPMYGNPFMNQVQPMYGQPYQPQMQQQPMYGQPYMRQPQVQSFGQALYGNQPQQLPRQQMMPGMQTGFMDQMNNIANGGLDNIRRANVAPQQTAAQPVYGQVRQPAPQPVQLETEYPQESNITFTPVDISQEEDSRIVGKEIASSPITNDVTIGQVNTGDDSVSMSTEEYIRLMEELTVCDIYDAEVEEPAVIDAPYEESKRVLDECSKQIKDNNGELNTDSVVNINKVLQSSGAVGTEIGKIVTDEFNSVVETDTEMKEESTGKTISIPKVEEISDISDLLLGNVPDSYKRITSNPKYAKALGNAIRTAYGIIFNSSHKPYADITDVGIKTSFMDKFSNKFYFKEFNAKGLGIYAHRTDENKDRIDTLVAQKFKTITPLILRKNYIIHNLDVDDVNADKFILPKCAQTDILRHILNRKRINGIIRYRDGKAIKRTIGVSMDGSIITKKIY